MFPELKACLAGGENFVKCMIPVVCMRAKCCMCLTHQFVCCLLRGNIFNINKGCERAVCKDKKMQPYLPLCALLLGCVP